MSLFSQKSLPVYKKFVTEAVWDLHLGQNALRVLKCRKKIMHAMARGKTGSARRGGTQMVIKVALWLVNAR